VRAAAPRSRGTWLPAASALLVAAAPAALAVEGGPAPGLAHGGDVAISASPRARLGADLAAEDLGEHRLKNVKAPVRVFRLR